MISLILLGPFVSDRKTKGVTTLMKAITLHNLGVPCRVSIKKQKTEPYQEKRVCFYVNPQVFIRHEPSGATLTPPNLYSTFIHVDNELADLLKKRKVNVRGWPAGMVKLLLNNNVLIKEKRADKQKKLTVRVDNLPTRVLLEVTSKCNCNCKFCYFKSSRDDYSPSLSDIKERITKLKKLGVVLFEITGGEPFLRDDLCDIFDFILEEGLYYYVVTNGEYLKDISERCLSALKKSFGVAVSFDGVGETHNKIRRREGLFSKMIEGLSVLRREGIPFFLICSLSSESVKDIPDMIKVAEEYESVLHLRPFVVTGAALEGSVDKVNWEKDVRRFLNHPKVRNGFVASRNPVPECRYYGCGIRKRISVGPKGHVFPCVMDRMRRLNKLASYSQEGLVRSLKKETEKFLKLNPRCKGCEINKDRLVCGGFCRFSNTYKNNVE